MSEKRLPTVKSTFKAADFLEALSICQALREKDPAGFYAIEVLSSSVSGSFSFPYSNFLLKGQETIITGNKAGKDKDEMGQTLTTWKTPTLTVTGSDNIFEGFHILNTALDPQNKGTSVALAVYGSGNIFRQCLISSTQDTLFLGPLPDDLASRYLGFLPKELTQIEGNCRNYFSSCHILGSVDFIFGAGQGLFLSCEIESVEDGRMGISYVTAPAHSLKDEFGFLFSHCRFTSQSLLCQRVYLSRPWRDFGKCAFYECNYGNHIKTEGFTDWSPSSFRYLTARYDEYPLKEGRVSWANRKGRQFPDYYRKALEEFKG